MRRARYTVRVPWNRSRATRTSIVDAPNATDSKPHSTLSGRSTSVTQHYVIVVTGGGRLHPSSRERFPTPAHELAPLMPIDSSVRPTLPRSPREFILTMTPPVTLPRWTLRVGPRHSATPPPPPRTPPGRPGDRQESARTQPHPTAAAIVTTSQPRIHPGDPHSPQPSYQFSPPSLTPAVPHFPLKHKQIFAIAQSHAQSSYQMDAIILQKQRQRERDTFGLKAQTTKDTDLRHHHSVYLS